MTPPSITALVTAYNAERHIGETLEAILTQTRPPEELLVVDDGSTDGTADELARFGAEIRVVRQANRGHAAAINRGIEEARGDYVSRCDADDIWEPTRLERQASAVDRHPAIDIAFGAAWSFGAFEGPWRSPPGEGLLAPDPFARAMYSWNFVCASTVMIRRKLWERLGPFAAPDVVAEDYDYWLRALRAGAVFYYDPAVLVRYRRHARNVTNDRLQMRRATLGVHTRHADLIPSKRFVRSVLARDLADIGRSLVEAGEPQPARASYMASLRQMPGPHSIAWTLLLSAPTRYRRLLIDGSISMKRALRPRSQAAGW
jgi:glycosyltransferase involved in cell wall biosynthesis